MEYKKFVFGDTLRLIIRELPKDIQLDFLDYSINYGLDGIEPKLKGLEAAAWLGIKTCIDNTMPKRGNPSFSKGEANPYYQKDNSDIIRDNYGDNSDIIRDNSQKTEDNSPQIKINNGNGNGNGNENENENLNENEKEREDAHAREQEPDEEALSPPNFSKNSEKAEKSVEHEPVNASSEPPPATSPPQEVKPSDVQDFTSLVEEYRKFWNDLSLPKYNLIVMNVDSLEKMRPRLASHTKDFVKKAMQNAAELLTTPGFDEKNLPGSHFPNFRNFFIGDWIDYFSDENKPFEQFLPKSNKAVLSAVNERKKRLQADYTEKHEKLLALYRKAKTDNERKRLLDEDGRNLEKLNEQIAALEKGVS